MRQSNCPNSTLGKCRGGVRLNISCLAPIFRKSSASRRITSPQESEKVINERIQGTGLPGAAEGGSGREAKNPQQVSRPARARRSRGQGAAGRARSAVRPPGQGRPGARRRQGRSQAPRGRGRSREQSPARARKAGSRRPADRARGRAESGARRALRRAEEEE